jgi:chromosome segregation ATPase
MKTEKNSRIRNTSIIVFFVAVIVLGLFIVVNKENKIKELNNKYSTLNTMYTERDSLVNDFNNTFDEIEKSLTFVKSKRSQLSIEKEEGNPSQKETVVADIKLMNTMLEESSKKIDDLEKKLKQSGINIKSFKNKIAELTKNVEEQNASIEQFKNELQQRDEQIAQMDEKVTNLTSDIQEKDNALVMKADSLKMKSQMITEKDNEMNKAYFAMGTYKELKDNGVVEKDGGFLGIGRNEKIQSNLNDKSFTEVDKRNTDVFPIFSKKVEMISQHPDSSYRYIYDNDQIAYLKIENPDEFWKYSKYAVVEVK